MSKRIKSLMHIIVNMLKKFLRIFYAIFCLLNRFLFSFHNEKIVVKQGSIYNNSIIVSSCGSRRIMRFNSLSSGAQSEIDLNCIGKPSVEYIKLMIISLIYYRYELDKKKFLIIGLGGGILPRAIRKLYPMSLITIIEIDPIVNEIAKKYFFFKEDSLMKVFIIDGRDFLNNLSNSTYYDIIYLDAYDSISGLPYHMKTKEFFLQLKNHLNLNGGLLILNLVCVYKSYLNVVQTINSVFGSNNIIKYRSNDFLNMVLIACSSVEQFPIINHQSNIINQIEKKLSININSLLKRKEEQTFNNNLSRKIYTDHIKDLQYEEDISLRQFFNLV